LTDGQTDVQTDRETDGYTFSSLLRAMHRRGAVKDSVG